MKNCKRPVLYILLSSLLFALLCGVFGGYTDGGYSSGQPAFFRSLTAYKSFGGIYRPASAEVYVPTGGGERRLIPGGNSFGVKIYADGLIAVGFNDVECDDGAKNPALDAGLKQHDIITKADGKSVTTAEDFVRLIEKSGGKDIALEFKRDGKQMKATVRPVLSSKDGKYRIGMWLRDSTAGIGTVTYVDPENLCFGGLGHGICDSSSGELVPLSHGSIADVDINSVSRGTSGTPGELKGSFSSGKRGSLTSNTQNGVFGMYSSLPSALKKREAVGIGTRDEIHDGDAVIYSTLGDDGIGEYTVKISDIDRGDNSSKSFAVTVTDSRLIERAGGIVQGMSGSPIIQDGKLVGAVTHVLVSDPTKGYGIFIENMLEEAR